ncbi:MAG TPA: hypothetical protein VIU62_20245 [Chloroflexota bacterium]
MFRRLIVSLAALVYLALPASPALAQSAPPCQFILGFATLHNLDTADTGSCLDNQAFAANGDAQEHTTNGLMAWRKADNWTAFTNGYWTWINGPNGLAKRLNTQRFSWEANPDNLPLADAPAGHTFYASSYYTANTIYCDDDPGWRSLSPAYLVSYPSLAAAEAALPGYHLHQAC